PGKACAGESPAGGGAAGPSADVLDFARGRSTALALGAAVVRGATPLAHATQSTPPSQINRLMAALLRA
ncbi:MAG TPA: hypothetical protein PKA88_17930, partial [Polyangiaceae bacterium]|nr:hypothetical protein [Polyangiaceae bacterium]